MGSFVPDVHLTRDAVLAAYTNKEHPLGTRGKTPDGRSYAYAKSGEILDVGIPLTVAAGTGVANATGADLIADTEDITSTWTKVRCSSTETTAGASAGELADGYFVVELSTQSYASGQMVRILTNSSGSSGNTDSALDAFTTITFNPDDRLTKGCDTDAAISLMMNEYMNVIEQVGGSTNIPIVGVPNFRVASGKYFWAQTWGPCPVLTDGTVVRGDVVKCSTATDQGLQAITLLSSTGSSDTALASTIPLVSTVKRPDIGWVLGVAGADNDYTLMYLTIRP